MKRRSRRNGKEIRVTLDAETQKTLEECAKVIASKPGQLGHVTARSITPECIKRGAQILLAENSPTKVVGEAVV